MAERSKLKVLFVIDTLEVGGAEKSILAIAARLREFEGVICSLYPGSGLLDEARKMAVRVIQLDVIGSYNFIECIGKLGEVIRTERPAIVHATLFRAEVVSRICLRNSGIPLIGSFVNDSYSAERFRLLNQVGRLKLNLVRLIDMFTARWVTHFVSITNAIATTNTFSLGIDPKRVTVIYRGRDTTDHISISEGASRRFRRLFGGAFTFLSVARLVKRKGIQESIEAFGKLVQLYPESRYLIAGEGYDRPFFERQIQELHLNEKVFLLGTRSDVNELLAYADVFVFPSYYEGQGGALIEAMLAGKPVIASNIPVVSESIEDGRSGILFGLRDVKDLATKMNFAIENFEVCRSLGVEARKVAVQKFDVVRVSAAHELLYKVTLERSRFQ